MRLRQFAQFGSAWTNLADLARMPFLEELQLQCGRVDVSTLGSLERLRVLSLDGEWFGDLSWLARNPVEELSLSFWGSPVRMDLSFLRGPKFAANTLPYDEVNKKPRVVNITGIATRYNNTWQILIRKESDIEIVQ